MLTKFQIDTTNLAVPAKLANSIFLQDLSKISGTDLVGQGRTRQSLGLFSTYSVALLTACGRNEGGSTTCSVPRVGFTFNPSSDLKLGPTTAQGTLSTSYQSQLRTYAAVSTFVAVAYILASLLTVLSCFTILLSRRIERGVLASRIASGISALLLFAATVASIVTFIRLRDAFNSALGDSGVKATISSSAFALSAVASIASVVAFVFVILIRTSGSGYRLPSQRDKRTAREGADNNETGTMWQENRATGAGIGLLGRVATWNRPRYAQLDGKKLLSAYSRYHSPESDREGLIDPTRDNPLVHENDDPRSLWENQRGKRNLDNVSTAYGSNAPRS